MEDIVKQFEEEWVVQIDYTTGKERDDWWYLYCKEHNYKTPNREQARANNSAYYSNSYSKRKRYVYEDIIDRLVELRRRGLRYLEISNLLDIPTTTLGDYLRKWEKENGKILKHKTTL